MIKYALSGYIGTQRKEFSFAFGCNNGFSKTANEKSRYAEFFFVET